jgi:hypothetical protein
MQVTTLDRRLGPLDAAAIVVSNVIGRRASPVMANG